MFVNTAMEDEEGGPPAEPLRRKAATEATINMSKKNATRMRKVSSILRKKNDSLTLDDKQVLEENAELVEEYHKRREKRAVWQSRKTEQEDTSDVLQAKCEELAQAIHDSEFLVVYTGAGISTAASIPDYRGPNGIWTLLQKGQDIGHHDLSAAEPTLTHMALSALYHQGIVRHVVSQNCDGLHLRSGLPKTAMSEVHGNMYIEVCIHCVPAREYVRTMDVTERTSTFKHTTGRRCYRCGEPLIDTIVHFGERGRLRWPLNWQGACQAANACDTILCLGSSLKVLKKYPWLWQMGRPPKKRPRLYIVNLQWTPKDKDATLKINGRCDEVMARVMKALGFKLPHYSKATDPIFTLATPLHPAEANTASRPCLMPPQVGDEEEEEEEEVVVADDIKNSDVTCREVEQGSREKKWGETGHVCEEESKKMKLESVESEVKEKEESIKREQDNVLSQVKERENTIKRKLEIVESEVKEEKKESMMRGQDSVESEVKEEKKESKMREQDSVESEVKEEKEESRKRKLDSMESEVNEEKEEGRKRKLESMESEVKKEESRKRKLDNMESEVKEEKCEGNVESKDAISSKPINGLHVSWNVERFPLCPVQGGNSGFKYLKLEKSDPESKPDLAETKEEMKQETDLMLDIKDEVEEEREAETLGEPGSREFDLLQTDSAGEMCTPKGEGGQLGSTNKEEVCSPKEEGGQKGTTDKEVCNPKEEKGQLSTTNKKVFTPMEEGGHLGTTDEEEVCSPKEEGDHLGTTDEEVCSPKEEGGQLGTTDEEEACSPKEEGGHLGTTDEEEVKSEPPDTDEDFHTFDMDGEPWEHTPDVDVASPKSSASCCSDSESSEKGEDCQTEDCQTEDSDTGDSQHQRANQMDYFKLAYASTNVQMARQGQALLKQNDFYGTGLCIRSFVSHPKTGERSSKAANSGEQLVLKGLRRARSEERSDRCGPSSSPLTEEESDVSSLPNHCQAAEALSSSDSECPPCECGSKTTVSSSSSASDNPTSCSKCKNPPTEDNRCLSPDMLSVLGSVRVEVSSPGREQLSESQVTEGDPQLLSVNTVPQDTADDEEVVMKANNVLCHSELDLHSDQVRDGSFLLRTHVVDGIITTTCVEAMAKEASGTNLLPCISDSSSCNVPVACSSQSEVTSVSVPCLSLNQKALMPTGNKSTIYIDNSVSKAQVKAITEHLQCQRPGSKFSSELSTAESAELKSIWYQSFCGKNSDNNLSALTVMMEMNECNLGRGLSYVRPKGADIFSNSEKSSSVILKNICAEAVNDSAAQHRNSTKKLKGSDDENVKCIWFWGFDSSTEGKEKVAAAEVKAEAVEVVESTPEEDTAGQNGDCHPVGRVTRSRTRASCDAANQAPPEEEVFKCHCSGSNPELCRIASLRPSRGKCDEDIQRARDIIQRRRTCNYRRYEPVFEKKLVSLTYERTRAKRKSKFEAVAAASLVTMTSSHEDEEEEEDHEGEAKEEEQKVSDGEECRDRDEKGDRKFSPGWYGKGLRKGMKKKTRV